MDFLHFDLYERNIKFLIILLIHSSLFWFRNEHEKAAADHTSRPHKPPTNKKKKPAAETKSIEVVKSDDKDYPTNGVEAKKGDEP